MVDFNLGLLADNAHVDANGKLYILGEFRYVFAASVPARHGQFYVVARWEADTAELRGVDSALEIEIVDGDGQPIMPRSPQIPLTFGPIGEAARGRVQSQVILQMQGLVLPKYGDYVFHFFVNGVANGKVAFYVASPPPQKA